MLVKKRHSSFKMCSSSTLDDFLQPFSLRIQETRKIIIIKGKVQPETQEQILKYFHCA